jgi:hypothetical protein
MMVWPLTTWDVFTWRSQPFGDSLLLGLSHVVCCGGHRGAHPDGRSPVNVAPHEAAAPIVAKGLPFQMEDDWRGLGEPGCSLVNCGYRRFQIP